MSYFKHVEENIKFANYIEKSDDNWLGINILTEKFNFANTKGCVEILIAKEQPYEKRIDFAKINLGPQWLFIFSEIMDIYSKRDRLDNYHKAWKLEKQKNINNGKNFKISLFYSNEKGLCLNITDYSKKEEKIFVMYFKAAQFYSLVRKILDAVKRVNGFKIVLENADIEKKDLLIRRSDTHKSTLIVSYGGIKLDDVFLSESDKRLIQYSCESRLFNDEWLSIQGEKINISKRGLLTTIDDEFLLFDNDKNKGAFFALSIIAAIVYDKKELNE